MKDCYLREVESLGETNAHSRMAKTWNEIEQMMIKLEVSNPVKAIDELLEKHNNDRLLHTQYYSSVFFKKYISNKD